MDCRSSGTPSTGPYAWSAGSMRSESNRGGAPVMSPTSGWPWPRFDQAGSPMRYPTFMASTFTWMTPMKGSWRKAEGAADGGVEDDMWADGIGLGGREKRCGYHQPADIPRRKNATTSTSELSPIVSEVRVRYAT